jgi:endonuclease YncB( thermonuclease family)
MRPIRLMTPFVYAALLWTPAAAQMKKPTDALPYQLYGAAQIIDGSSFIIPSMDETVRLLGYDAPDPAQIAVTNGIEWPAGEVARSWLIINTLSQVVNCKPMQRDAFGRVLAHCFVGARNLALAAIQEGIGFSYSYPGEPRVPLYVDAERSARGIGRGVWSGRIEAPAEYRARVNPPRVARPQAEPTGPVTIPLTLPPDQPDPAPALPPNPNAVTPSAPAAPSPPQNRQESTPSRELDATTIQ